MSAKRTPNSEQDGADPGDRPDPPSPSRIKLKTIDDVKCALGRLYREGHTGQRDVSDVSKLANVLGILGRLIVDNELAERIEALEQQQDARAGTRRATAYPSNGAVQ